jgi:plasmid segregation protein ParM
LLLVCIDNGYGDTKVKTSEKLYKFNSKIQSVMNNDGSIIKYDNINYQVGTGHDDIIVDKSNSLTHKLCLLRAIAENAEDGNDLHIMLDLPLTHYYNVSYRNELRKFLQQNELIIYNGTPMKINIERIDIYPQGLVSLYANNVTNFSNKIVGIIDIGAVTIDGCIIDNLKPIKESMFSINLGTKILENQVKTKLNQELLLNLQDYQMPYIIKDGIEKIPEAEEIITKVIEEYLVLLKREMMGKNWSLDTLNIFGVGGGSQILKDFMEINFNYTESNNPVYDNVLGLWNIGKALL